MRVLLPTHQIEAAGIGTVIDGLARFLPQALASTDELILAGNCPRGGVPPNVRCLEAPWLMSTRLGRFLYEQTVVAQAARTVDIVHLANPRALLVGSGRFVLTVHDVFFLDHPEWYPGSFVRFKRAMLAAALRKQPRAIVCDSRYTRERLLTHYPALVDSDVRVIHPGIATPSDGGGEHEVAQGDYFLTVATFEPRKNHLGLLGAFQEARRRGLSLRWKVAGIEGYRSRDVLSLLRRSPGVDVLGRVSDDERERLYANATFFAFPSHAEGFGIPPLEAMARGVPTICSAGTAMDETVGEAALRVGPADTAAWAEALLRLASDEGERSRLRTLGLERARTFDWSLTARRYVDCYEDSLGRIPRGSR